MIANGGIAVTKFVAYAITGSSSMLSEAIHSVADTGNQVLLLIGGKRSLAAPDAEHQFGYGRRRYVYAFVVAIILFMLGGMFSLYEGWHKISHPEELTRSGSPTRSCSSRSSWSRCRSGPPSARRTSPAATEPDGRSSGTPASPSSPSSCSRTSARCSASCFALFGITMAVVTGDGRWDGVGSLAIGTLLVCIAVFLAFEMSGLLVGESALPEEEAAIRAALGEQPGVDSVIHMRTLHTGPGRAAGRRSRSVSTAARAGHELARHRSTRPRQRVRAAVPTAKWIYLEPDIERAPPRRDRRARTPCLRGAALAAVGARRPAGGIGAGDATMVVPSGACRRVRTIEASWTFAGRPPPGGSPHGAHRAAPQRGAHDRLQGRRPVPGRVRPQRDPPGRARDARPDGDARRVRHEQAADRRPDHRLPAHDHPDRRADRDPGRPRRARSAGPRATSTPPRTTRRRPSSSARTAPPRTPRASRSSPGRARRSRSTGGAPSRSCAGRGRRRPPRART